MSDESGRGNKHWQQCEMPGCPNDVPTAKGICDGCCGVGGEN